MSKATGDDGDEAEEGGEVGGEVGGGVGGDDERVSIGSLE